MVIEIVIDAVEATVFYRRKLGKAWALFHPVKCSIHLLLRHTIAKRHRGVGFTGPLGTGDNIRIRLHADHFLKRYVAGRAR
ncbi:hypothetical protein D3C74_489790 [compost metagenome]